MRPSTLPPSMSSQTIWARHGKSDATSKKVLWRWEGGPFGSTAPNQDPQSSGTQFVYNLRFQGQYWDNELGRMSNGFRDYDPNLGRYIESDPIGLGGGINTYAYVESNPPTDFDTFGLAGGRGERGATGGSSGQGSANPYKHCRQHPTDSNKIECKHHQTGKWVPEPKPSDWPDPKKAEDCKSLFDRLSDKLRAVAHQQQDQDLMDELEGKPSHSGPFGGPFSGGTIFEY